MSIRQQAEFEKMKQKVADLESRYDRLVERMERLTVDYGDPSEAKDLIMSMSPPAKKKRPRKENGEAHA